MDLRQHVRPIAGQQFDGETGNVRRPRRVLSMVAAIVAVFLLGAAVGKALPPMGVADTAAQFAPAARSAPTVQFTPAAQPSEPFVYFPSQYVNQATESEEHIQSH